MKKFPHLEPHAKECIDACAKEEGIMAMTAEGFQTDEEALKLRDLLLYARSKGVGVQIMACDQEEMEGADIVVKENF